MNPLAWHQRDLSRTGTLNGDLRRIAQGAGIRAVDKAAFICAPLARRCDAVTPDGYKAFYDYGHFTLEGARRFGTRIAWMHWFPRHGPGPRPNRLPESLRLPVQLVGHLAQQ